MTVSLGLVQSDDIFMRNWQCTMLGPMGSAVDSRIISCAIHAGDRYPDQPPEVQFQTKVNFPFVVSRTAPREPLPSLHARTDLTRSVCRTGLAR